MEPLTVLLPEEIAFQLKTTANKSGVTTEDFLLASLQEKLAKTDPEFISAMQYVLEKNTEIYKRLA